MHFAFPGNIDFAADDRGTFMYYSWNAVVFIHRLWNNVYHRWITNNFPCKWQTSATSGSKSSPRKIFHRNSSGPRTPTSNSVWTTKEKTSTRNRRAERTAKAMPTTRDRGTGDWNIRGIMIVLHCRKPTFISLPVSPPMYGSKSAKFQLCTTAGSIIIFMRTWLPYLCFVFVCFFFSKSGGQNNAKYAFQNTFKNNTTQYAKKKKKKRKNNVWTFTTIFAVGQP